MRPVLRRKEILTWRRNWAESRRDWASGKVHNKLINHGTHTVREGSGTKRSNHHSYGVTVSHSSDSNRAKCGHTTAGGVSYLATVWSLIRWHLMRAIAARWPLCQDIINLASERTNWCRWKSDRSRTGTNLIHFFSPWFPSGVFVIMNCYSIFHNFHIFQHPLRQGDNGQI